MSVISGNFPELLADPRPIHELIFEKCRDYGDEVAIIDEGVQPPARLTFRQVEQTAKTIGANLHQYGLKKGDIVIICLPNCTEWITCLLGVLTRGAAVTGLNVLLTAEELSYYIKDCDASMIITDGPTLPKFNDALKLCNKKCKIFVKTTDRSILPANGRTNLLTDLLFANDVEPPIVAINPKTDLYLLPYSSGTSGHPKGVRLPHFNATGNSFFLHLSRGEPSLTYLPLSHMYGMLVQLGALVHGNVTVILPKFTPTRFLEMIQKYKLRLLHMAPPIAIFLTNSPLVDKYDISSLKAIYAAAAPLGPDACRALAKRLPNLKFVMQIFGMSEHGISNMSLPIDLHSGDDPKFGSVGVVTPNYEMRVVDVNTGALLGPDEKGEIHLRCAHKMLGYLHRPEDKTIDDEGWLHTEGVKIAGDIGYYDSDEWFYVIDRLKELIKVKGFQVAPAELEDVIGTHPAVTDVAVVGIAHVRNGETPYVFVVAGNGKENNETKRSIADYVASKTATYKHVDAENIQFVRSIPKLPNGKILRRQLRDLLNTKQAKL